MLLLLLACLTDSTDRLDALEAENAELRARVEQLEAHSREIQQELARWEQVVNLLDAAATGRPISPEDLNAPQAPEGDEVGGCTTSDDGHVTLPSAVLSDAESLSRSMRVVPHKNADRAVDGFRISGVRRDSIAASCGLRNGDIVHSVNGHPLTSVDGAMQAYSSLAGTGSLSFEITRRGQEMTLSFSIE